MQVGCKLKGEKMGRLVDYDELKWQLTHWYDNEGWAHQENKMVFNLMELDEAMEKTPTIDPVKHGHWINDKGLYKCSVCNELWCHWWANTVPIERMNKMMRYCPLCGAKMTLG